MSNWHKNQPAPRYHGMEYQCLLLSSSRNYSVVDWDVSHLVEYLTSSHKRLDSIPRPTKTRHENVYLQSQHLRYGGSRILRSSSRPNQGRLQSKFEASLGPWFIHILCVCVPVSLSLSPHPPIFTLSSSCLCILAHISPHVSLTLPLWCQEATKE